MIHEKKMAIGIIPLLFMAILLSSQVYAYTFTSDFSKGFYWQSFPIKMNEFVTDAKDGVLLDELTSQAEQEWEDAVGKNIWDINSFQVTTSFLGNYIKWSDDFGNETGYDPSKTLAITIRYNQGTNFQQTVIILNGSLSYLRQNFGNSLKTTILHEMGHTLGLDHSEVNAIMAANLSSFSTLQPDDIEGINAVVNETINRQSTHYISPYSTGSVENKRLVPTCGTTEDVGNTQDPKNGTRNFIGSLLIGFIISGYLNPRRKGIYSVRY